MDGKRERGRGRKRGIRVCVFVYVRNVCKVLIFSSRPSPIFLTLAEGLEINNRNKLILWHMLVTYMSE